MISIILPTIKLETRTVWVFPLVVFRKIEIGCDMKISRICMQISQNGGPSGRQYMKSAWSVILAIISCGKLSTSPVQ